jgi:tetratricopeptide (TPR) repeat protein
VARVAVERNPGSAAWFDRIGDLHAVRLGEVEDALRTAAPGSRQKDSLEQELLQLTRARVDAYRAAILIVPDPNVIAKCAQTLMTATPPQPALAVSVMEEHPEAIKASPVVRTIYARAIAPTAPRESVLDHLRIAYRELRQRIAEEELRADQMAYWFGAVYEVFGAKGVAEAERFATDLAGGKPDAYELLSLSRMWQLSGPDGLSRRAELLEAATAICPKDDEQKPLALTLYRELGFALLQLQQNREALDAMKKVCELNPNDAEAANNVAYLLAETMSQPAEALPYAKRAIELQPGSWSILDTIGWVHFRLDQLPEAERYLRESVAVRENASNLYHLAALRDRQGDHAQALKHAERAAELQPDPETRSQLNRLTDDIKKKLDRR